MLAQTLLDRICNAVPVVNQIVKSDVTQRHGVRQVRRIQKLVSRGILLADISLLDVGR
jgi:3-keto-L-gulonate-6-phosphate decarboxylase